MCEKIRVRKLEYSYGELPGAFKIGPLDLDLEPGHLVFWVGANGSGKSTLARILSGDLKKKSGSISGILGQVTHHHQALEENIFSLLTVSEHLRLLGKLVDGRLDQLLHAFPELNRMGDSYPDELSGGQLQILAFASLVLRPSQVWIFDEILNHLDTRMAERVMDWIACYLVKPDSTVIVITHDLKVVASRAESIIVFSEGNVLRKVLQGGDPLDSAELASLLIKY